MFMGISFFRLGKFSSMILLKIFTGPLSWESSLSSIPIILRFDLPIESWISCMFWTSSFFCFTLSLTVVLMISMESSAPEFLSSISCILLVMLEDFKKDMKNSLREMQENINKQVEAYREESQKSLKEFQENTIKQLKEVKMEIEAMKKEQRETTLDMKNQRK